VALVASGRAHWLLLVVLVNLPVLVRLLRAFRVSKPAAAPEGYPVQIWPLWFSAIAFDHTRKFTTLFIAALLAGHFLG
jgi:1,4-dihydroxy-2-naphthoate octaprenyltransferase